MVMMLEAIKTPAVPWESSLSLITLDTLIGLLTLEAAIPQMQFSKPASKANNDYRLSRKCIDQTPKLETKRYPASFPPIAISS